MDYKEFSAQIKTKYPQYKDVDDKELAEKIVAKYPVYKDKVTFGNPVVNLAKRIGSDINDVGEVTSANLFAGVGEAAGAAGQALVKAAEFGARAAGATGSAVAKGLGNVTGLFSDAGEKYFDTVADNFKESGILNARMLSEAGGKVGSFWGEASRATKEEILKDNEGYQAKKKREAEEGAAAQQFEWKDLTDKDFLLYDLYGSFIENAPTMAMTLYTGGKIGAAANAAKFGKIATFASEVTGTTLFSTGINAMREAESAYSQAKSEGLSDSEATTRGERVLARNFKGNVGLEAGQMMLLFASSLAPQVKAVSPFMKGLIGSAKVGGAGVIEAGQERMEDAIQSQAGDADFKLSQALKEMTAAGISKTDVISFLMGATFQGAGNVFIKEQHVKKGIEQQSELILENAGITGVKGEAAVDRLADEIDKNPSGMQQAIEKTREEIQNGSENLARRAESEKLRDSAETDIAAGKSPAQVALELSQKIGTDEAQALVDSIVADVPATKQVAPTGEAIPAEEVALTETQGKLQAINESLLEKTPAEVQEEFTKAQENFDTKLTDLNKKVDDLKAQVDAAEDRSPQKVQLKKKLIAAKENLKKAEQDFNKEITDQAQGTREFLATYIPSLTDTKFTPEQLDDVIDDVMIQLTDAEALKKNFASSIKNIVSAQVAKATSMEFKRGDMVRARNQEGVEVEGEVMTVRPEGLVLKAGKTGLPVMARREGNTFEKVEKAAPKKAEKSAAKKKVSKEAVKKAEKPAEKSATKKTVAKKEVKKTNQKGEVILTAEDKRILEKFRKHFDNIFKEEDNIEGGAQMMTGDRQHAAITAYDKKVGLTEREFNFLYEKIAYLPSGVAEDADAFAKQYTRYLDQLRDIDKNPDVIPPLEMRFDTEDFLEEDQLLMVDEGDLVIDRSGRLVEIEVGNRESAKKKDFWNAGFVSVTSPFGEEIGKVGYANQMRQATAEEIEQVGLDPKRAKENEVISKTDIEKTPQVNRFKKAEIITDKVITLYRGEGKGIGNTTFVKGMYFADSEEFAKTFGDRIIVKHIPAGAKIFDFDKIKNDHAELYKTIPHETLLDPDATSELLLENGYSITKNTNSRGVEYVFLNGLPPYYKIEKRGDKYEVFDLNNDEIVSSFDTLDEAKAKLAELVDNNDDEGDNNGNEPTDRNSGNKPDTGNLPEPVQDSANKPGRAGKAAAGAGRRERRGKQPDVSGDKLGKRPGARLTNEEVEQKVSSITQLSAEGEVLLTGEITEEILEAANQYTPGGKSKEGRGVLDEYYTSNKVVDMVKSLLDLPTKSLKVLEPSVGTGNFLYALPETSEHTIIAHEINPVTARIAKIFHPKAKVLTNSFETLFIDERGNAKPFKADYDLVIGNPPYGEHRGKYLGLGEEKLLKRYEDYFIKRGLDLLKEGGTLVMVVPSSFLRSGMERAEKVAIAKLGTLENAFRLPNGSFEGTDIGTDIIIFKKGGKFNSEIISNDAFFTKNPNNVLGRISKRRGQYGMEQYVEGNIEEAVELFNANKNSKEAIEVLKDLGVEATAENIETTEAAIEETGEEAAAEALVKQAQKKGKETIAKKVVKKTTKTEAPVSMLTKFEGQFSEREIAAWKDTQSDGTLLNHEKHGDLANFMGEKWYIDFNYAQGDIYEKLEKLEGDRVLYGLSDEQYNRQKAKLEAVKPTRESISDMKLSPNIGFVHTFSLGEDAKGEELTLRSAFLSWIRNLPRAVFGSSSEWEVREYVNNEQVRGSDKERNELIRGRRKVMADNLFAKFMAEGMSDEQRDLVVDAYNRTFNFYHTPDYKNVPMFSNVHANFQGKPLVIRDVQKHGIGRLVNTGVGILAHDVGFGKTMSGVLALNEVLHRGWAKKPLVVAPNENVYRQWVSTIEELVPDAKLNLLGNLGVDFKGDLSTLSITDGSITLLTYEGFKRLGFNDETYANLSSKFGYIADDLEKHKTERQQQKANAAAEEKAGRMKKGTRADLSFETLGFDHITFDEVHNANHIVSKVKLEKGQASEFNQFSLKPSDLGIKTWLAAQYIQQKNGGRNVNLLSATPFTNHPLEYYSILSLIADKSLQKMGLLNVNDFFGTFMEPESESEFKADGSYQKKTDIRKFRNYRQFRKLLDTYIDFKEGEGHGMVRPDRVQQTYEIPQNMFGLDMEAQAQAIFKESDKGQGAKVLRAIGELRKIAFSPYASKFAPDLKPTEYKRFVDDSPKIKTLMDLIRQNKKDNTEAGQIVYVDQVGVEFLPMMRDYLVREVGYKPTEVEIISGATAKAKRIDIQDKYNNGDIKIILGSAAIKEGMNLQVNTSDIYILSLPWNFTQLRQVIGRAWRQGNKWANVRINNLFIQDSVDIFLSQKLENKQKRYEAAIKSGDNEVDVGDVSFDELKFDLVRDPEVRAKLELGAEKEKLEQRITQEKAELAFATIKLEKINEIKDRIKRDTDTLNIYLGQQKDAAAKGEEYDDYWIKRYQSDIEAETKKLDEEVAKLQAKGIDTERLLKMRTEGEQKVAALEAEAKTLTDSFDERVKKLAATMQPRKPYSQSIIDALVLERSEQNKTFYQKRVLPSSNETIVAEVVEKPIKSVTGKVVKTKKTVEAKRQPRITGETKDKTTFAVLNDSSLSTSEKVDKLLNVKQENKEFKDIGERVSGSKKERAVMRTVIELGGDSVFAEMVERLGADAVLSILDKNEILEDTQKPDETVDQANGVPAVIAKFKSDVYDSIARKPVFEKKGGRGSWGSYTMAVRRGNVSTSLMPNFKEKEAFIKAIKAYPGALQQFVTDLTAIRTKEDVTAFARKYGEDIYTEYDPNLELSERFGIEIGIKALGDAASLLSYRFDGVKMSSSKAVDHIKKAEELREILVNAEKGETETYQYRDDSAISYRGIYGYTIDSLSTNLYKTKEDAISSTMGKKADIEAYVERVMNGYATYFKPKKKSDKEEIDLKHGNFKPLDRVERSGKAIADERAVPQTLTELGFKSVQFGNYMDDATSREHIRHTIGAIEDIAEVLNINVSAMIAAKGLSLAYGARGGGSANAHYEPAKNIINLTKGRGDGSFFHEFVHFMDLKLGAGSYRGKWSSKKERYYRTDSVDAASLRLMQALTGRKGIKMKEFTPEADPHVRETSPVLKWFSEGMTVEEATNKAKEGQYEYRGSARVYMASPRELLQNVSDVYRKTVSAEIEVWHEPSDFIKGAQEIGGGYWERPEELLARAAQAYIEDKMTERGMKNNYITRTTIGEGTMAKAYPQGNERKQFNAMFDKLFDELRSKYPRTDAKLKAQGTVSSEYTLTDAGRYLEGLKKRLNIDFDVHFVESISQWSLNGKAEAYGAMADNTIAIVKDLAKRTAEHETVHLTLANLDKISVFRREGVTREKVMRAKAEQMGIALTKETDFTIEEQLANDFERYIESKHEPRGIVRKFFILLKTQLLKFARAIGATKGDIIKDYYDLLSEGEAVNEEMVRLENKGIIEAYIEDGNLDLSAIGGNGDMRLKVKKEGDARLNKLTTEFNELITLQEKLEKDREQWKTELDAEIERKAEIAPVVEQTPANVKELARFTTKTPPAGMLTPRGKSELDQLGFANEEEAQQEISEYLKRKTELIETRNRLRTLRGDIAAAVREGKTTVRALRDIERRLKLRKHYLEQKAYHVTMGIGRGKKEQMRMIWKRGRFLSAAQDMIGLSDYRTTGLIGGIGRQRIYLMSEKEFDDFMIAFVNKGRDLADTLSARDSLRALIYAQDFKNVDNVRHELNLPAIDKMTEAQAELFESVLSQYQQGDIFLTQRQLETIHRTDWTGVRTQREMHERIFSQTGVTREDLQSVDIDRTWQKYKNWLILSRSNPAFAWLVDRRFKAKLQSETEIVQFEKELNPIVRAARKSREKTIGQKVAQAIAPIDQIVFDYIESENKEEYAEKNNMTKEELELAHFLIARLFEPARQYMAAEYDMEGRENYITHARRTVSETFMGAVREGRGFKAGTMEAIREMLTSQKEEAAGFKILGGKTGEVLAFEKWFQFAMPRSGALMPTKNVARASMAYARAYFTKKQLDTLIPEAMAMVKVHEQITGMTPKGLPNDPTFGDFVKQFINDAKGRKIDYVTTQGDQVDTLLKAGIAFTALKYLGFRPVMGAVNFIGEFVGTMRATTAAEKWNGLRRTFDVKHAGTVNEQYEFFTGRNPFLEIFDPENGIGTRVKDAAMVLFSAASFFNNRFYLRAKMTEEEWQAMIVEDERMLEITKEMSKWRMSDFYIKSLAGHTTTGSMFSQFATWAFPVVNTTLSDLYKTAKKMQERDFKGAITSEEARSLGKTVAVMGTLFFIASVIKALAPDDDDDRDVWFYITREMNTFLGAFQTLINLEGRAPLIREILNVSTMFQQFLNLERYKQDGAGYGIGDLKGFVTAKKLITPSFVNGLFPKEQVNTKLNLINEAVERGTMTSAEAAQIAATVNPDGWNNIEGTRNAKEHAAYQKTKIGEIKALFHLKKQYGDSEVADLILNGKNNDDKLQSVLGYAKEHGVEQTWKEVKELHKDRNLCANPDDKTGCLISGALYKEIQKNKGKVVEQKGVSFRSEDGMRAINVFEQMVLRPRRADIKRMTVDGESMWVKDTQLSMPPKLTLYRKMLNIMHGVAQRLPFMESDLMKGVRRDMYNVYPVAPEAKNYIERYTKLIDAKKNIEEETKYDPVLGIYRDPETNEIVVGNPVNDYFDGAAQAYGKEDDNTKIALKNISANTVMHEALHAYTAQRKRIQHDDGYAFGYEQFNEDFEREKENGVAVFAVIDNILMEDDLYSQLDEKGIANERFAYLGEALGAPGLEAFPENMQKHYEGVFSKRGK